MKKNSIWLIVIIVVILNILLLWTAKKYKQEINTLNESISSQKPVDDELGAFFLNILHDQYESNGLKIDNNKYIGTSNNDSIRVRDLCKNKPKLIYNFKNITCKVCIDDELKRIEDIAEKIGKENVILIQDFNTLREMFVMEKHLDMTLYSIQSSGFNLPIDVVKCPYIFVLDSNSIVNDLFIPTKQYKLLADIYFETILEKHW